MLRLPDGMRDRIRLAAERNGRSMNSEIVALLEEHFPSPLSSEAELNLASVAALMFSPVRTDSEFSKQYEWVIAYIADRFGFDTAEQAERQVKVLWQDKSIRESILVDDVRRWVEEVLVPWAFQTENGLTVTQTVSAGSDTSPDFIVTNSKTGEETDVELKQTVGRGLRLQKPNKGHTTAVEPRTEKPTPRQLKRPPKK
ncbi:Arc family DNA-binding protein [Sulfitobacter sp. CS16]|uniref:Arc family DNA-binding protein n=1 Tax=Sulfitobacter sp. CS16 TaxID=3368573 RepID=UPI0037472335